VVQPYTRLTSVLEPCVKVTYLQSVNEGARTSFSELNTYSVTLI